MKKILSILLVGIMCFTISGCSNNSTDNYSNNSEETEEDIPSDEFVEDVFEQIEPIISSYDMDSTYQFYKSSNHFNLDIRDNNATVEDLKDDAIRSKLSDIRDNIEDYFDNDGYYRTKVTVYLYDKTGEFVFGVVD